MSEQTRLQVIAAALSAARRQRGMTQEDVAFELRLRGAPRDSLATVGRWETGGSIKLEDAMLLAIIYKMSMNELLSAGAGPAVHQMLKPSTERGVGGDPVELGSLADLEEAAEAARPAAPEVPPDVEKADRKRRRSA